MKNLVKIISIVLIIILILNIVFFALGKINTLMFWAIIILAGISSYVIKKFIKQ